MWGRSRVSPVNPVTTAQLEKSLWVSILLPVVLMMALAFVFYAQIRNLLDLNDLTRARFANMAAATRIQKLVVEIEADVQGSLLTREARDLEFHKDAVARLPNRLAELESRLLSEEQRDHLRRISVLIKGWENRIGETIETVRRTGEISADDLELRRAAERIRFETDLFVNRQAQLLEEQRDRETERVRAILLYVILFSLIAGVFLALNMRKQIMDLFHSYEGILEREARARAEVQEMNVHLEERIQERTAELRAVNEELEAFSYSVSHDLRAPLRGVDGFSQALLEDYSDRLDESGRSYLTFIREGAQRMGHLIDDLLRLSRINRVDLKREDVHLTALAAEAFAAMKEAREFPDVPLRLTATPEPPVKGDRGLLLIALENLFQNALKYSSKAHNPKVEFGEVRKDGQKVYFVKDNGVGFDMKHAGQLFGAFQRLHAPSEFGGSGVGLATVKRIIVRHGGEIWAESVPDQGATFYFTLPTAAGH